MTKLVEKLSEILIANRFKLEGKVATWVLSKAAKDPKQVQHNRLMTIIDGAKDTEFGKEHNFAKIKSVADFRKNLPIGEYETLRPYIEKQDQTGKAFLLNENILYYAYTSGTTGKPKLLPVTQNSLKSQKRIQKHFIYQMLKKRPRLFRGKVMSIVSPAVEGYVQDSGKSFGSTSGHFYETMPQIMKNKYILPSEIFEIEDYDLKYLTIARIVIQEPQVSFMCTANPSTWARLIDVINKNADQLIEDLSKGSFSALSKLSINQQRGIMPVLVKDEVRASKLKKLLADKNVLRYQDLFPQLELVGCWTGGSSGIFLEKLKGQFTPQTAIQDVGYLSSEFRGTIPLSFDGEAGLPTFRTNFLEFANQDKWDDGERDQLLGVEELKKGERYYIFLSNATGLYRYNMNDIVEVTGFYHKTPLLKFVQKGKGVTNITGEKLYESQVIQGVNVAKMTLGLDSSFFMAIANEQESRYQVYVEDTQVNSRYVDQVNEFESELEKQLRDINVEYDAKRQSSRLKPLQVLPLKFGAFEDFKQQMLGTGQREGQFKIVALQYAKDLKVDLNKLTIVEQTPLAQTLGLNA